MPAELGQQRHAEVAHPGDLLGRGPLGEDGLEFRDVAAQVVVVVAQLGDAVLELGARAMMSS